MNLDDLAFTRVYRRLDGAMRALLLACQTFIRYIQAEYVDQTEIEVRRELCLVADNRAVFRRLAKRLEALRRRLSAVMGETTILLFADREAFEAYEQSANYRFQVKRTFSLNETTCCICLDATESFFLVTNQQELLREKELPFDLEAIWEQVLLKLQPEAVRVGMECYCRLVKFDGYPVRVVLVPESDLRPTPTSPAPRN